MSLSTVKQRAATNVVCDLQAHPAACGLRWQRCGTTALCLYGSSKAMWSAFLVSTSDKYFLKPGTLEPVKVVATKNKGWLHFLDASSQKASREHHRRLCTKLRRAAILNRNFEDTTDVSFIAISYPLFSACLKCKGGG